MSNEMNPWDDAIFGNFSKFFPSLNDLFGHQTGVFSAQIYETDTHVMVSAALPGVHQENINVDLTQNVLTIKAEHIIDGETQGLRRETSQVFVQSFSIPGYVDCERVKAGYKNGKLEISFPKRERPQGKQIPIE